MKKKTSLKDIAQQCGVSIALVSYVINNKKEGRIRKEVAQKIRETAVKLQYRPNEIAKSLKTNKTYTIGLIVADISNPFSSGLARIIEDEANNHGYTVIFGSSDENASKSSKLIDTFLNRQVDGLIISPPAGSEKQIMQLKKQQVPFVLLDRYFPDIDTDHVSLDNYTAAYEAVRHLTTAGRKKIGMITYKTPLHNLQERERGYRNAIKGAKIEFKKGWLQQVSINNDQPEIERAVKNLLHPGESVNAMLFGSNRIAVAALKYINSISMKVPEELSLVSFDETETFDFFHAPLTYVRQPLSELGKTATQILIDNISKKRKTQQLFLSAQLVVRRSSI
jgi:LacI family transcriptional regulator